MKRFLRILFPVLTILVLVFIFSNSFAPKARAEEKRDRVVNAVHEVVSFFSRDDSPLKGISPKVFSKLFHVAEFGFFSLCLCASVAMRAPLKKYFERILLCGLFAAVTDEYIQLLSSGRKSSLTDVLIDFAGVLMGYCLVWIIVSIREKRVKK